MLETAHTAWIGDAVLLAAGCLLLAATAMAAGPDSPCQIGVARIDITPDGPIRLSGYGGRRTESEGVTQPIWAKALAVQTGQAKPALLITVDNCGLPAWATEEIATHLEKKAGLPRERIVVCSTHIHTGPCLAGILPTIFCEPIPDEHQKKIDRYTRKLIDQLQQLALSALDDRRPAELAWTQGEVKFAANRRLIKNNKDAGMGVNPDGPVDHALPMLRITDTDGKLRALVINYACHCTALDGNFNQICGDWAGYAAEYVERDHPGATCLITIGCGADMNPEPRTKLEHAQQQGRQVAAEVDRLLKQNLTPLRGELTCRFERISLPFDKIPSRQEWADRVKRNDRYSYYASRQLARLDRGEALQTELSYPVQTWSIGQDLAMVFLAGEVVVDYSLRFKKEFDRDRLWVTAYANDLPCYIPSRRILAEGGYEADGAMMYYDRPTRLAPEVEELIATTVRRLVPASFRNESQPGSDEK